jgi:hypothetical protein
VDEALDHRAARGNVAIASVAKRVSGSRADISSGNFANTSGSAQSIARIARIHSALDLLQTQPSMSGAEIAVTADQRSGALIRDASSSPARRRNASRPYAGSRWRA